MFLPHRFPTLAFDAAQATKIAAIEDDNKRADRKHIIRVGGQNLEACILLREDVSSQVIGQTAKKTM